MTRYNLHSYVVLNQNFFCAEIKKNRHEWTAVAEVLRQAEGTQLSMPQPFNHRTALIFLCQNDTQCEQAVGALPDIVPLTKKSATSPEFAARVLSEPTLRKAVGCGDLLLWNASNMLLANWAKSSLWLGERGAYIAWPSELQMIAGSSDKAREAIRVLQEDVLRLQSSPTHRRRLAYGKC